MGSDQMDTPSPAPKGGWVWLTRMLIAVAALIAVTVGYAWFTREEIAASFIDDYLAQTDLEARYTIVSIGPQRQILEDLVVGDPNDPDLVVKRATIDIGYGFAAPAISAVKVEGARLYGTLREGKLSFGALDSLIFESADETASGLPSFELELVDTGAIFETDFGDMAATFEGAGLLDNGFSGTIAAVAPLAEWEGCTAQTITAFGSLTTKDGEPAFEGPVRLRDASCEGAVIGSVDFAMRAQASADFSTFEGALGVASRGLGFDDIRVDDVSGSASFSYRPEMFVLDHDLAFAGAQTGFVSARTLGAKGVFRASDGFANTSWNAQLSGEGLATGPSAQATLDNAKEAGAQTLVEPLLAKLERALSGIATSATLSGDVTWRRNGTGQSLVIPEARVAGEGGETILALSRFNWSAPDDEESGLGEVAGDFFVGGPSLPQINGRMTQDDRGQLALRLSMEEYREGANAVAVPGLSMRQLASGRFRFAGQAKLSGDIPGGLMSGVSVPLNGDFESSSGLVIGLTCEEITFDQVTLSNLALEKNEVELCPGDSGAILRYAGALKLDMVTRDVALSGDVSQSPAQFALGRAQVSYPGEFELAELASTIGEEGNAFRLQADKVVGRFGATISGAFYDTSGRLEAVPLNLDAINGEWSFANEVVEVGDATFVLSDRPEEGAYPRFRPLAGAATSLRIEDGEIAARAALFAQGSSVRLADVAVIHGLEEGTGSAVIDVPDITFGPNLSLEEITDLATGVIAYTQGTVSGNGRVAWTPDEVSSSGVFRSDGIDLAAAFGPVTGLAGEVRFADLLEFTTEPSQTLSIASVNPGIEALDGRVRYAIEGGTNIIIEDARWPFMGGELIMEPTRLQYGTDEEQSYTFEVTALDAAKFVAQMELSNIGATGLFDGRVPIVFDQEGNGRIEGGVLRSRAPGGNVSYIGELTYEDLGAISNYAFQSLRSLDYRAMEVDLSGDLAGEIITRFGIDGVRQGADADQNFVTRRLAELPIRFNVNVRSENFYELATMVRTFWDPEALPGAEEALRQAVPGVPIPLPAPDTEQPQIDAVRPPEPAGEPPVQPSESEPTP